MKLRDILREIDVRSYKADMDIDCRGVAYDSRKVQPGDLFVAVKGYAARTKHPADAAYCGAHVLCVEYHEADYNKQQHIYMPKRAGFLQLFEQEELFYYQQHSEIKPPYDKVPRCTVPEAGKKQYYKDRFDFLVG